MRDRFRRTQSLLQEDERLGIEPQYCGGDLLSPALVASVKSKIESG
jgi:hypothetical protein